MHIYAQNMHLSCINMHTICINIHKYELNMQIYATNMHKIVCNYIDFNIANMQIICKKYAKIYSICNKNMQKNMQNMHKSMYWHILHIYALHTLLMLQFKSWGLTWLNSIFKLRLSLVKSARKLGFELHIHDPDSYFLCGMYSTTSRNLKVIDEFML